MAICLECGNPSARITSTRAVRGDLNKLMQVRFMRCERCGIVGQEIRSTGVSERRDIAHDRGGKGLPPLHDCRERQDATRRDATRQDMTAVSDQTGRDSTCRDCRERPDRT